MVINHPHPISIALAMVITLGITLVDTEESQAGIDLVPQTVALNEYDDIRPVARACLDNVIHAYFDRDPTLPVVDLELWVEDTCFHPLRQAINQSSLSPNDKRIALERLSVITMMNIWPRVRRVKASRVAR